jgi:ABC-2 type transport system permease protein
MEASETHGMGNSGMVLATGVGWRRGSNNLLRGEFRSWFKTRKWWGFILIWALSVNLIYLTVAINSGEAPSETIAIFNIFLGLVGPIGVCIIMQGEIVGEKNSGTAAWILSKPVSRPAFVLSKLIGNATGVALTMILAQGLIAYLITYFVLGVALSIPAFLAGLGVQLVNVLFYLTMTLMLGAMLSHIAPVIAIPMAFLFSQNLLPGLFPFLAQVFPWTLAIPVDGSQGHSIATAFMLGIPAENLLPLYTAIGASIVFVALALWAFNRQEL